MGHWDSIIEIMLSVLCYCSPIFLCTLTYKSISGTVPVHVSPSFFIQEVVEQQQIEKHELQHQLREMESVLNRTKDDLTMEQGTRKLEQLQYRKTMERVTMKSCISYIYLPLFIYSTHLCFLYVYTKCLHVCLEPCMYSMYCALPFSCRKLLNRNGWRSTS